MAIDRTKAAGVFEERLSARLFEAMPKASVALANLPVQPMSDKTERMPVLEALPTAGFLAADMDVKVKSDVSWGNKVLTAEEIAVIVPISESAIADAKLDIVSKTEELIFQEFGRIIDAAVYQGTNAPASWPTGGLCGVAETATNEVVQVASPTSANIIDDLNALFAKVENAGATVDHFAAGRSMRATLRGLTAGSNGHVYQPTLSQAQPESVYGVPIQYPLGWSNTPGLAVAVDRSATIIGLRESVEVKILTEANLTGFGSLAEKDAIAIRAKMRVGFQVANPVRIETGAQFYPFAVYSSFGN